ncbi:beta-lactamase [Stachybotrys elegans]|uniref:Beta-lactamase n=1 Tax=Stachybotrys elegans TaxID=80388 RepID=A0A8K0SI50_9HYPO|nr:beta-lactamase [Stachybotrys elegans]
MAPINGNCDERFNSVKALLQGFLEAGDELGVSLAVNLDGEDVVDLFGGYSDTDKRQPWERDTIVNVFSTTKALASLAVLTLVSRGQISVNDKVSKHWPEFSVNGKEDIEVRHLLSHTSGVAGFDEPMKLEDLYDEQGCVEKLEKQAPWWSPGTASGYHSWSFGYLLGELVRRVTGLRMKEFIEREITQPLKADFQLGARESDWHRISTLIPPPPFDFPSPPPESITAKALMNPTMQAEDALTPGWRGAAIASGNGHGNARSIVRIFSEVTLAGKATKSGREPLLSGEIPDVVCQEQSSGMDLTIGMPWRFGVGYAIRGQSNETVLDNWLPPGRICVWGGWGGSLVIMDLDRGLTIGYAMNKMIGEGPSTRLTRQYVKAIYEALGVQI